jgi:SAM-dependent methyltransferase
MAASEELQQLAAQLRKPDGKKGIEIGDMMNATNMGMTKHAITQMHLQDHDRILELGHGNCKHLDYLLSEARNLEYHGLEMSELMHQEAKQYNRAFTDELQAHFHFYNGQRNPFPDQHFDKIFTVNTIYFWQDPLQVLAELHRVLKPGGLLCISFALESFMKQLPFTRFGFELYDVEKIKQLIEMSVFSFSHTTRQTETVMSKTGDVMEREFATVTALK